MISRKTTMPPAAYFTVIVRLRGAVHIPGHNPWIVRRMPLSRERTRGQPFPVSNRVLSKCVATVIVMVTVMLSEAKHLHVLPKRSFADAVQKLQVSVLRTGFPEPWDTQDDTDQDLCGRVLVRRHNGSDQCHPERQRRISSAECGDASLRSA